MLRSSSRGKKNGTSIVFRERNKKVATRELKQKKKKKNKEDHRFQDKPPRGLAGGGERGGISKENYCLLGKGGRGKDLRVRSSLKGNGGEVFAKMGPRKDLRQ